MLRGCFFFFPKTTLPCKTKAGSSQVVRTLLLDLYQWDTVTNTVIVASAFPGNTALISLPSTAQHLCLIFKSSSHFSAFHINSYKLSHYVNEPLHIDELATSLS